MIEGDRFTYFTIRSTCYYMKIPRENMNAHITTLSLETFTESFKSSTILFIALKLS